MAYDYTKKCYDIGWKHVFPLKEFDIEDETFFWIEVSYVQYIKNYDVHEVTRKVKLTDLRTPDGIRICTDENLDFDKYELIETRQQVCDGLGKMYRVTELYGCISETGFTGLQEANWLRPAVTDSSSSSSAVKITSVTTDKNALRHHLTVPTSIYLLPGDLVKFTRTRWVSSNGAVWFAAATSSTVQVIAVSGNVVTVPYATWTTDGGNSMDSATAFDSYGDKTIQKTASTRSAKTISVLAERLVNFFYFDPLNPPLMREVDVIKDASIQPDGISTKLTSTTTPTWAQYKAKIGTDAIRRAAGEPVDRLIITLEKPRPFRGRMYSRELLQVPYQ